MKDEETFYKLYTAKEALKHFSKDFLYSLNEGIHTDVQTLDREHGLGIFIKDNLPEDRHKLVSVAVVCEWHWKPKLQEKAVKFLKYHVYKGTIPNEVLDDINEINVTTADPVWKRD